jgi:pyrroline-5-carboxylate reductase
MTKKTKVGIIGCGNMGSAIAKGINSKYQVFIFDKEPAKTKNIAKAKVTKSIFDLINSVDAVILAVKPQDFEAVLAEIKNIAGKRLLISIAAGIPTKYIEKIIGRVKVIRVMPNLLVKIGKGVTALCKGKFATNKDLNFARKLFDQLGTTLVLEEKMMDADTAFLGSGPGFHYDLLSRRDKDDWYAFTKNEFIPTFAASGEKVGFSKHQAKILAKLIADCDHALIKESKESPGTLCIRVTSKGGTTEAGLKELKGDVRLLPKAVEAARKRAKELSRR